MRVVQSGGAGVGRPRRVTGATAGYPARMRTSRIRSGSTVVLAGVLAAGGLLGAGPGPAAAATTTPAPTASAAASTTITLRVRGCEGCTFGVERGLQTEPPSQVKPALPNDWVGPRAKVRNGVVRLTVPTAYTPGLSFTVSAPWEGDTDGITNIALGGGYPTGTSITAKQATSRKKATACWAGTASSQASIDVQVLRRTMPGMMDKSTVYAIAYASPTVPTVGSLTTTFHGLLGNQDMFFC